MAIFDSVLGIDEIDEQRKLADQATRERFDPNRFNPQLNQAQQMANEGIEDEQIRAKMLNRIFSSGPTELSSLQGLGSGRSLSFLEKMNQQTMEQIGQAETDIALREEQAMREGEQREAEIMSQMEQVENEREARLKENRLKAEAQASAKKKQFGSTIGSLAGSVAGSFLGPAGATIGGSLGGGLLGGAEGAVAGGASGLGTSMTTKMLNPEAEQMTLGDIFGNRGWEGGSDFMEDERTLPSIAGNWG